MSSRPRALLCAGGHLSCAHSRSWGGGVDGARWRGLGLAEGRVPGVQGALAIAERYNRHTRTLETRNYTALGSPTGKGALAMFQHQNETGARCLRAPAHRVSRARPSISPPGVITSRTTLCYPQKVIFLGGPEIKSYLFGAKKITLEITFDMRRRGIKSYLFCCPEIKSYLFLSKKDKSYLRKLKKDNSGDNLSGRKITLEITFFGHGRALGR